jgi:hypothetical protein
LYCSQDEDEKMMANSHLLIRTIGKCGTHVPIILTRKMKSAVDALVANWKIVGFSDSNPYVFGIPGCDTHLKAWTILNAICRKLKLPGITSSTLQKYLATTAQSLDLTNQQIGWMSRHLGHSIDVHTKYYRKHDRVIELGKITKLLHASQEGSLHKNRGKTIETMEVVEWDLQDYPIDRIELDGSNKNALSAQTSSADEEPQGPRGRTGTKSRKKKSSSTKSCETNLRERKEILQFFAELIKVKKVPGKKQVMHYLKESSSQLEWKAVKNIVHSRVQCLKKATKVEKEGK